MAVPTAGPRKSRLKAVSVPSRLGRRPAATPGASPTGDAGGDVTAADHIEAVRLTRPVHGRSKKHGRSARRPGTHRTGKTWPPTPQPTSSGPPAQSRSVIVQANYHNSLVTYRDGSAADGGSVGRLLESGRRDRRSINERTRALPAGLRNLPLRRTGCPARQTARPLRAHGPLLPRPMRCLLWPPPPPSAHPVRITAPGPTPPGPGSDPAAVIIDA
jgi:hypothetical protein